MRRSVRLVWVCLFALVAAAAPALASRDVNGDGFDDIPLASPGVDRATAFSIVLGKSGSDTVSLRPSTSGTLRVTGPFGPNAGSTVDGDLTADGFADIVVSDSRGRRGARGHVWIVPGRPGWRPVEAVDDDPSVTRIDPGGGVRNVLMALSAGDVDGDGAVDLLVVRRDADRRYAVIVLRGPFAPGQVKLEDLPAHLRVDLPWWSQDVIEPVGDVDGDGRTDLLIADEEYGWRHCTDTGHCPGRAFVVYGDPLPRRLGLREPGPGLTVIRNAGEWRHGFSRERLSAYINLTGEATPAAGDLDGDGRADLLLSFQGFNGGPTVIFYGRPRSPIVRCQPRTPDTTWMRGRGAYELAPVGDTDGDGRGDLLQIASETRLHACRIPGTRFPPRWRPPSTFSSSCMVRPAARGTRGYRFSFPVGDVNGDGLSDVLLQTTGPNGGGRGAYWTVIFSGSSVPIDAAAPGRQGFVIR